MKYFKRGERKAQKRFPNKFWGEKAVEDYYEDFHAVVREMETLVDDLEKFLKRSEGTEWPRKIRDEMVKKFSSLEEKLKAFRSAP